MTRSTSQTRGFTLIEMLVAVAVLAMVVSLLLQMVGISSSIMSSSSKKLDGLAGARLALDRIGFDLAARVKDKNLSCFFEKRTGNDSFAFFSEVDAYSANRKMTIVGYRVQETDANRRYQLERGVKGANWNDTYPQTAPSMANLDFDVLAEGILRMEFGYLRKDGQLIFNEGLTSFSNVAALVVVVAVLDSSSRKMLTSEEVGTLSGLFSDATSSSDRDLTTQWENSLFSSGLPPRAIANVRIFQRFYYVR